MGCAPHHDTLYLVRSGCLFHKLWEMAPVLSANWKAVLQSHLQLYSIRVAAALLGSYKVHSEVSYCRLRVLGGKTGYQITPDGHANKPGCSLIRSDEGKCSLFLRHSALLGNCSWGTGCLIHVSVSWIWGMSLSPLTNQKLLHSNPLGPGS